MNDNSEQARIDRERELVDLEHSTSIEELAAVLEWFETHEFKFED